MSSRGIRSHPQEASASCGCAVESNTGARETSARELETKPPHEHKTTPKREQNGGAARDRVALFDNVKGLLIILVVVGHIMNPVHNDNPAQSALFDIIYLFHMPLFVFISGLFAKNAYRDGRLNVHRIISFIVLGFAFQAVLLAINGTLLEQPFDLFRFTSAPWYLIAMAWWYALTKLLARLPVAAGVGASLVLALLVGEWDAASRGFLALSRAMSFLPYFAVGYYCPIKAVERLARRRALWLAVAAMLAIATVRIVAPSALDWFFPMVYGDNSYEQGFGRGVLAKLVTILIAVVFSLAVLRLVPRTHSALSVLGTRTLSVYVLHRLIRAWLTFHTPFYDLPVLLHPLAGTAILLVMSGVVTTVCALKPLAMTFAKMLSISWLPKSDPTPEACERRE